MIARPRTPPKFHVVSAWSPDRYPGPEPEETGLRLEPPAPPPAVAAPAPSAPPISESSSLPVPSPLEPVPSGPEPAHPSMLYNLPALLGRVWSRPPSARDPRTPVAADHSRSSATGPQAALPTPPRGGPAAPLPSDPSPAATNSGADRSPAPRWAHAWICPECRLTNAPWSKACTGCRTAAPWA